jgi:hypothetical protein
MSLQNFSGGAERAESVRLPRRWSWWVPAFTLAVLCLVSPTSIIGTPPAVALRLHPEALPNLHKPGEVDNPQMVPFIVEDPHALPGIVVDETNAALSGSWRYSTHTPPYVGLGYLHTDKDRPALATATFKPNLPTDGLYEVRLAHCANKRRAANALVIIHHADGETRLRINQQEQPPHERLFRTLGTFRFVAGTSGWVRVSNAGADANKVVIADAVQWLPVVK